jgi:hypothetical protein
MKYSLKQGVETFDVVDGPFAGRRFLPGREYAEIPEQEKHKFQKVALPPAEPVKKSGSKPKDKSEE